MKRKDEAGCRWDLGERERGTIENVKILKHLVGKSKVKRKKKMYELFIDLRAAFNNLDRGVMENDEGKRNQGKNDKVRKIYKETKCRVRIGKKESREFWTKKGVKQNCFLSDPF